MGVDMCRYQVVVICVFFGLSKEYKKYLRAEFRHGRAKMYAPSDYMGNPVCHEGFAAKFLMCIEKEGGLLVRQRGFWIVRAY